MTSDHNTASKLDNIFATWFQNWLDGISVCLAGLCLVHCLLTPILLIALPIIGTTFFVHENFHFWMVALVIPTTSIAMFLGCRKHKKYSNGILSAVGMVLLASALFFGHGAHEGQDSIGSHTHHDHHHGQMNDSSHSRIGIEAILTSLGGIFLASAHIRNYRLCRKSHCSH